MQRTKTFYVIDDVMYGVRHEQHAVVMLGVADVEDVRELRETRSDVARRIDRAMP